MQTVSIIGAGISGLALGQCLKDKFRVKIFEKSSRPGGLIQCDVVQGNLFHKVGGHVFNSKNKQVSDWFWSFFDQAEEFVQAKRNAKILLEGKLVGYPIENHLYQLDPKISKIIIGELMATSPKQSADFESFLINKFGPTLYQLYFKPYNTKIWKTDLATIPLEWLEGKLPMPNVRNILWSNIHRREESEMVHSTFYYPKKGGSQFIADRLAEGLDIAYSTSVSKIENVEDKLIINGEHESDKVVYTGDVRRLSAILKTNDADLKLAMEEMKGLRSNGTSNMLCECDPTDLSWLYLPEANTRAHRIIFTGNFSPFNNREKFRSTCVVEFFGEVNGEEMQEQIKMLPGNLVPIASNYASGSYVIQDGETRGKIDNLKKTLETRGLYLLGRFAEWEYYNMDKVIEASLMLTKRLP